MTTEERTFIDSAERDFWIRAFNEIENAITHHKTAHERDGLFVERADEVLWKARDKALERAGRH